MSRLAIVLVASLMASAPAKAEAGIHGNSHMMMMDKNNIEVASLIQTWLEGKGLSRKP